MMTTSTYPTRLIRMLVLGAVVAGTVASAAGALPVTDVGDTAKAQPSVAVPDVLERFVIAHPYGIRPVPDAIERFATAHPYGLQPVPDVLQRFVTAHPYGIRPVPDAIERFATAHPYGLQPVPDVLERFSTAHPYGAGLSSGTQSALSQSSGFDWADYGIGIGSGMGLILVLAAGLAMGWQRRHRMQTA